MAAMRRLPALALLLTLAAAVPAADIPGFDIIQRGHGLSLHKTNYILPATWSPDWHGAEAEVVFQLSIKQQMFINNLFFGYTQKSFWQAYNREVSAPFRETNYNPEVFYRWLPGDDMFRRWHLERWGFDAGFEHESNGQVVPLSRSVNKLYFAPFRLGNDGRSLWYLKAWYRLPEERKDDPLEPIGDDNPDYDDFLGWSQLEYRHEFGNRWLLHAMARGNLATGKGAGELQLSVPVENRAFFWVFSLFSGYGESLIDYDYGTTRVGIGLAFNR